MNSAQYQMMRVVQKIAVFKGLDVKEVVLLLKVSHSTMFKPGQTIYKTGEPGDEMLVLLKGELNVTGPAGEVFATIGSGNAIGEMGLFTGQPRSANIVAVENSACLVIRKQELIVLLSNNREMYVKLLNNVINLLSERLAEANQLNQELMKDKERLSGFDDDDGEEDEEEYEEYEEEEEEYPGDDEEEDTDDLEYDK